MNSLGEYLRGKREQSELLLRKVAAELDIDTSILRKIERNERAATKEMLPILSKILAIPKKELEVEYIKTTILPQFCELNYLSVGLDETSSIFNKR
ncbi:MAG TPA: helix-turn-helix transcriptional regulator [Paludibacter sp.]